jgi:hypothetical protein
MARTQIRNDAISSKVSNEIAGPIGSCMIGERDSIDESLEEFGEYIAKVILWWPILDDQDLRDGRDGIRMALAFNFTIRLSLIVGPKLRKKSATVDLISYSVSQSMRVTF